MFDTIQYKRPFIIDISITGTQLHALVPCRENEAIRWDGIFMLGEGQYEDRFTLGMFLGGHNHHYFFSEGEYAK